MTNEEMYNLIIEDIKNCKNEESRKNMRDCWIKFCENLFYPSFSKNKDDIPYFPLETVKEKQEMLRIINKLKKI